MTTRKKTEIVDNTKENRLAKKRLEANILKRDVPGILRGIQTLGRDFNHRKEGLDLVSLMMTTLNGKKLVQVLSALVDNGVNILKQRMADHIPPFHRACFSKNVDVIEFFYDHGASLEVGAPLLEAARGLNVPAMRWLLDKQVNRNVVSADGKNFLNILCGSMALSMKQPLLGSGFSTIKDTKINDILDVVMAYDFSLDEMIGQLKRSYFKKGKALAKTLEENRPQLDARGIELRLKLNMEMKPKSPALPRQRL